MRESQTFVMYTYMFQNGPDGVMAFDLESHDLEVKGKVCVYQQKNYKQRYRHYSLLFLSVDV